MQQAARTMSRKLRSTFFFAATLIPAVHALCGCSSQKESEPQPTVTVQVATAEKKAIQSTVTADAILYPRDQAEPDDGVYPRYYPGLNAVRVCNASYVQEYRPSGTVIVPRMSCFWRPG